MSDNSSIEWTDATWTVAVGCTRASRGCDNCYAATFVNRGLHPSHKGLTIVRPKSAKRPGIDWNGKVRTLPENLSQPLRWKRARRIFVGSMTDLWHRQIPNEYIAAIFGVAAMASHHTYQFLTKRASRLPEWFAWLDEQSKTMEGHAQEIARANGRRVSPDRRVLFCIALAETYGITGYPMLADATRAYSAWPLPCVHLGVSVEDQETADERIPALLRTPAAIRWVSCEPQLGAVAFDTISSSTTGHGQALQSYSSALDWCVVGGESGSKARAFDVTWAREVLMAGRLGSMRVYVKQLGSNVRDRNDARFFDSGGTDVADKRAWPLGTVDKVEHNPNGVREEYQGAPIRIRLADRKGGDWDEWPADLRVREAPPGHSAAWDAATKRSAR